LNHLVAVGRQAIEQQIELRIQMTFEIERLRLEGLETVLPDDRQQQRRDDDAPGVLAIHGAEFAVGGALVERCDHQRPGPQNHFLMVKASHLGEIARLGDDELRETLRKRAETVTSHYRGRFAEYDLNNEMIHGNYYEKRLGPQITSLMAQWAHNGDPDVQLYLNDYDILTGRMLPEYMSQIRTLLKQGVPVAGIGAQGHLHAETFDRVMLRKALDSLATFKLPGQRSKYYEKPTLKMTPQEEESAARELVDYYKICFAHPSVEGILMWGFWEGANWIPQSSMYRRDWTITPLGQAYKNLVFKELWTNISGTADSKGVFTAKVFYGRHRITIDGISKEVNIKKSSGNLVTVEIK